MRTVSVLAFVGLLSLSSLCAAQRAFDGTWRPDPQIYSPTRKPDVLDLANGTYACRTCTPPYKIKADGHDQPISGNPDYETLSISVVGPRSVRKIGKKGGHTVVESEMVVSDDGQKLTERQTIYFVAPRLIEFTTHSLRVAAGSGGAHPISGTWRMTDGDVTNHAEDTIFKVTGNVLEMSDRMGRSFAAKLDGTEAPYNGSEEFTSVSLKLLDDHTIEESDRRSGKVVNISRWSVSSDGKTMHVRFDDMQGHVQEQTGRKVE